MADFFLFRCKNNVHEILHGREFFILWPAFGSSGFTQNVKHEKKTHNQEDVQGKN
jgi:hypothetical protein